MHDVWHQCRQAYEEQPPHVDLLLLGCQGGTVYNGPQRLITPYLLSIGLGNYGGDMSKESLQDIVSSPGTRIPFLDGQVSPSATSHDGPSMGLLLCSSHRSVCHLQGCSPQITLAV